MEITIYKTFKELPLIEIDDKTHKLFYNCSAYAKATDVEVSRVLEFIYNLKAKSNFTKKLQDSVILAKSEPIFKDEYMYFADILEMEIEEARETGHAEGLAVGLTEGREKGLAEGLAQGKSQGLAQGRKETAVSLIKEGIALETISKCTGIPLEEVRSLAEQSGQ